MIYCGFKRVLHKKIIAIDLVGEGIFGTTKSKLIVLVFCRFEVKEIVKLKKNR